MIDIDSILCFVDFSMDLSKGKSCFSREINPRARSSTRRKLTQSELERSVVVSTLQYCLEWRDRLALFLSKRESILWSIEFKRTDHQKWSPSWSHGRTFVELSPWLTRSWFLWTADFQRHWICTHSPTRSDSLHYSQTFSWRTHRMYGFGWLKVWPDSFIHSSATTSRILHYRSWSYLPSSGCCGDHQSSIGNEYIVMIDSPSFVSFV